MSNSLRDKLLQLGFKAPDQPQPEQGRADKRATSRTESRTTAPRAPSKPGRAGREQPQVRTGGRSDTAGPPRSRSAGKQSQAEIDLAKAYALRAQVEKREREAAERARQEQARLKREARAKVAERLSTAVLNDPQADIARHFPYGGKIRRIHVTEAQLKALNDGQLGVVQQQGRYLLVDAATLADVERILPEAVALKVDPDVAMEDDPYADPRFRVPDDLVW